MGPISQMSTDYPTAKKPGFWSVLDQVLGGKTITDAKHLLEQQQIDDQMRQQAYRTGAEQFNLGVNTLGADPRELLTFLSNDKKWGEENASRYGVRTLAPGSVATVNGKPTIGAPMSMAPGHVTVDPLTGKQVFKAPRGPEYIQRDPDKELLLLPGEDGGSAPSPATPAFATAPLPARRPLVAGGGGVPRGYRNNNPGNIRDNGDAWQGKAGTDQDGFVRFDTPENGRRALERNLETYGTKHGINTVEAAISRWAPPSDSNPTDAYAAFVRDRMGVEPGQQINLADPQTRASMADAIVAFENGLQSASRDTGSAEVARAQPPLAASAPKEVAADQSPPPVIGAISAPGDGIRVLSPARPKASTVTTLSPEEVAAAGFLPGTIVQRKPDGSMHTVQTPATSAGPRRAEADLRKEFNNRPEVKEYRDVGSSYRQISTIAGGKPSAPGDLSLIFSYMKMLDPGSVVREGEFATAQNAAGVPDRVVNAYNKARNGQILNPNQRAEFTKNAEVIYETRRKRFNTIADEYRGYAEDYGITPDRVVTTDEPVKPSEPKAPAGAKRGRDGRYYIEDPAKPGSFPRVQLAPDGNWYLKSASGTFLRVK